MTTSHTPGPWKLWHSGFANTPFDIYSGERAPTLNRHGEIYRYGGKAIALVIHDESPEHEEQKANARLIAAAPELLAALQEIANHATDGPQDYERMARLLVGRARAAVAEAVQS